MNVYQYLINHLSHPSVYPAARHFGYDPVLTPEGLLRELGIIRSLATVALQIPGFKETSTESCFLSPVKKNLQYLFENLARFEKTLRIIFQKFELSIEQSEIEIKKVLSESKSSIALGIRSRHRDWCDSKFGLADSLEDAKRGEIEFDQLTERMEMYKIFSEALFVTKKNREQAFEDIKYYIHQVCNYVKLYTSQTFPFRPNSYATQLPSDVQSVSDLCSFLESDSSLIHENEKYPLKSEPYVGRVFSEYSKRSPFHRLLFSNIEPTFLWLMGDYPVKPPGHIDLSRMMLPKIDEHPLIYMRLDTFFHKSYEKIIKLERESEHEMEQKIRDLEGLKIELSRKNEELKFKLSDGLEYEKMCQQRLHALMVRQDKYGTWEVRKNPWLSFFTEDQIRSFDVYRRLLTDWQPRLNSSSGFSSARLQTYFENELKLNKCPVPLRQLVFHVVQALDTLQARCHELYQRLYEVKFKKLVVGKTLLA